MASEPVRTIRVGRLSEEKNRTQRARALKMIGEAFGCVYISVIRPSREYIPENGTRLRVQGNEELLYRGRARYKRQIVCNIYACVYVYHVYMDLQRTFVSVYRRKGKERCNSKIYSFDLASVWMYTNV